MKKQTFFKTAIAMAFLLVSNVVLAQGNAGAAAIDTATSSIEEYIEPAGRLIQAIGGVVGIIGGVRIYNKWQNGDNDTTKELIGWVGAVIFLLMVPTIITTFFGF